MLVNGITDEADPTVYTGKVIRPLRSVDPTQTEYQGMIEVMEDGEYCFNSMLIHVNYVAGCLHGYFSA